MPAHEPEDEEAYDSDKKDQCDPAPRRFGLFRFVGRGGGRPGHHHDRRRVDAARCRRSRCRRGGRRRGRRRLGDGLRLRRRLRLRFDRRGRDSRGGHGRRRRRSALGRRRPDRRALRRRGPRRRRRWRRRRRRWCRRGRRGRGVAWKLGRRRASRRGERARDRSADATRAPAAARERGDSDQAEGGCDRGPHVIPPRGRAAQSRRPGRPGKGRSRRDPPDGASCRQPRRRWRA